MSDWSPKIKIAAVILTLVAVVGLMSPIQIASAESLGSLLQRQADLQRQAQENQKKIDQKKSQVNDLQGTISGLDDNITATQDKIANTQEQIAVTEQVISELRVGIDQAQSQLTDLQGKLDKAYVSLYELSQAGSVDSILTASSLSELVTQTQYIQSLQTELQANIDKANTAKADLEAKQNQSVAEKASLDKLKSGLTASNNSLNNQRSQKNNLLVQTQGQQAQFEALLKKIQQQSAQISDAIYLERQKQGGFVNQTGTGGYTWANNCNITDPWLYYTCQCTSYAAWKFLQIHGVPFYNTRPGSGSAYNWPALARDQGYTVDSFPRIGDAVSWDRPLFAGDQWGHVAIVEQVYSANDIRISEYNWSKLRYTERRINPNNYGAPRYLRP